MALIKARVDAGLLGECLGYPTWRKALHELARFADAQESIYRAALSELESGQKRSHWMWFIFPQLKGLGYSAMAQHYAIADLDEAKLYLADTVLGGRLKACVAAVLKHPHRTAHQIFGSPDDLKFRSCLTLFEAADPCEPLFREALGAFYQGQRDPRTTELLNKRPNSREI
jgi:uncharacterized protein (DUF1810 family)